MNDLLDGLKKLQSQTKMFDDVAELGMKNTPPGMAHWSGTGPEGTSCRECALYTFEGRYTSGSKTHPAGGLKPGRCRKYHQLMKRKGKPFVHSKPSCKHFERNPNPPMAVDEKHGLQNY